MKVVRATTSEARPDERFEDWIQALDDKLTFTEGHEGRFLLYGLGITHARLLMTDGASLEGHGVVPDEVALPAASDLADGRDPVLARGTARLGAPTTPAQAGKAFPRRWR